MAKGAPHPRQWRKAVMDGKTCAVCGWEDGTSNPPELHGQHLAHLVELTTQQRAAGHP